VATPSCTPEVQRLYTSKMARPEDDIDMARVLRLTTRSQRTWSAEAIARNDLGHPWSDLLDMVSLGHHE